MTPRLRTSGKEHFGGVPWKETKSIYLPKSQQYVATCFWYGLTITLLAALVLIGVAASRAAGGAHCAETVPERYKGKGWDGRWAATAPAQGLSVQRTERRAG